MASGHLLNGYVLEAGNNRVKSRIVATGNARSGTTTTTDRTLERRFDSMCAYLSLATLTVHVVEVKRTEIDLPLMLFHVDVIDDFDGSTLAGTVNTSM